MTEESPIMIFLKLAWKYIRIEVLVLPKPIPCSSKVATLYKEKKKK